MCKQLTYLMCISLILCLGIPAGAAVFTDSFDAARDYLTEGVAGTGWDGFVGQNAQETAGAINASIDRAGQLFLQSAGAYWEGSFSPKGPFLYKMVEGDFVATVRVTDFAGAAGAIVQHNDSSLMARVPNLDDAGAGEDFVSIHYFPTWVGNMRRQMDNGAETEGPTTGDGFNCARYLQLERVGDTFFFRRSFDGVTWTAVGDSVTRTDMAGLAVQVGLAHCTYSATSGYVAFDDFMLSGSSVAALNKSYNGVPANGSKDVVRNVVLSWTPSEGATGHNVYFGTSADAMAAVATAQDANSYDVGVLDLGTTYYWRVDDLAADGTVNTGDLWSFTIEPVAYPIANVTATASSQHNADMSPRKTVDGSGLDAAGLHGTDNKTMWSSLKTGPQPTWIQYAFDRIQKVDHMLVWNSNQGMEAAIGVGAKDVTIEYSTDGSAWATLGDFEFAQAAGEPLAPEAIDLSGIVAKYVKLTINSNWGEILPQYGLSEVRFYAVPTSAREPHPASGAENVDPETVLSWRAGREAVSHAVSLGTDEQAVIGGTAPVVTVSEPQYDAALDLSQSYFWKVVEVNDAMDPSAWAGDVWTFSTAEYLVVDDFESYTDDMDAGKTIFQTWADGYQNDTNGSLVGYGTAPFAERTIVTGGRQSMPLEYDNAAGIYAETTRTFENAEDWTQHGIKTLVINFRGKSTNTAVPLYVKINNTKVLCNGGAAVTALPVWKQWNIDLATTGASLKSVKSLTIGIGDGSAAAGAIFVDDIRLYRSAPAVVVPADPGNAGIVANYTMEGTFQDSSAGKYHGAGMGTIAFTDSLTGHGQAASFNGTNSYIDLPIGSLVNSLSNMTISMYANFAASGGDWQRIFDFGSSTTNYMFLCPRMTAGTAMRFAIRTTAIGEQTLTSSASLPTDWHHVAIVIDSATMTMRLQVDGAVVATGSTTLLPKDLGATTQNWLGRSQFEADAYYMGMLDDFRIYNRALSVGEVRYLAGDR